MAIQRLEYAVPQNENTGTSVALITLPSIALVITLISLFHAAYEEPFMVFTIRDAVIEIGAPLLVLCCWVAWFWLALWKRRLTWIVLPITLWAILNLWLALWLLFAYFHEGWNS
jgi:hypothetical protein